MEDSIGNIMNGNKDESKSQNRIFNETNAKGKMATHNTEHIIVLNRKVMELQRENSRLRRIINTMDTDFKGKAIKTPGLRQTENMTEYQDSELHVDKNIRIGLDKNSYQIKSNDSPNAYYTPELYALPRFSGKSKEWPLFQSIFMETTKYFQYSDLQNILRLRNCLEGKANILVESLLVSSSNVGKILEILEFHFGRPDLLLHSQLDLVRAIRPITTRTLSELIGFAVKIMNLTFFLESIKNSSHYLYNPTLLSEIIEKIPFNYRVEWTRHALKISPYPSIKDFAYWIFEEARIISLATSSYGAQSKTTTLTKECKNKHYRKCTICKRSKHSIYSCKLFKEKSIRERWNLVKRQNLCFSCLKKGHTLTECHNKIKCGIDNCVMLHNRFLHSNRRHEISIGKASYKTVTKPINSCVLETFRNTVISNAGKRGLEDRHTKIKIENCEYIKRSKRYLKNVSENRQQDGRKDEKIYETATKSQAKPCQNIFGTSCKLNFSRQQFIESDNSKQFKEKRESFKINKQKIETPISGTVGNIFETAVIYCLRIVYFVYEMVHYLTTITSSLFIISNFKSLKRIIKISLVLVNSNSQIFVLKTLLSGFKFQDFPTHYPKLKMYY